jgi:hypothetical protein
VLHALTISSSLIWSPYYLAKSISCMRFSSKRLISFLTNYATISFSRRILIPELINIHFPVFSLNTAHRKTTKQKCRNKIQNKAQVASVFLLVDQIQGRHGANSCFVRSPETTPTQQFKKNQTNLWKNNENLKLRLSSYLNLQ